MKHRYYKMFPWKSIPKEWGRFTSVIHFTREKRLLLVGLAIILFQVIFWSFRVWTKWIKSLKQQVRDFETEENK